MTKNAPMAFLVRKKRSPNFYPDASKLISILQPGHDEIVVDKDRFWAFSGNDLKEVLRSGGIKHLEMAGVATSGVTLSTFTLAADEDYSITILSDACVFERPAGNASGQKQVHYRARTVHFWFRLKPLELAVNEKQIPQVAGNLETQAGNGRLGLFTALLCRISCIG